MMAASMLQLVGPLEFAQKSYFSNAASSKIGKIDYLDAKHRRCGSSRVRDADPQAFAYAASTVAARHVGGSPGLSRPEGFHLPASRRTVREPLDSHRSHQVTVFVPNTRQWIEPRRAPAARQLRVRQPQESTRSGQRSESWRACLRTLMLLKLRPGEPGPRPRRKS